VIPALLFNPFDKYNLGEIEGRLRQVHSCGDIKSKPGYKLIWQSDYSFSSG
jgi:hypothetical protein